MDHNVTMIKDERRLLKRIYLSLYCKDPKRVTQGFAERGSWRPNIDSNILTPTLMAIGFVSLSRSPGLLNRRPRGPALCWMMAFFTASYLQLVWSPNSIGGPEGPFSRVCLSLPHLVSISSDLQLSNFQLNRGPRGPFRLDVDFPTISRL